MAQFCQWQLGPYVLDAYECGSGSHFIAYSDILYHILYLIYIFKHILMYRRIARVIFIDY